MPELHMVRLVFDAAKLVQTGRLRRLPLRDVDVGYLVHCQLAALFGEHAPRPFAVERVRGRRVEVLGYATQDTRELRERARESADLAASEACAWNRLECKPMPETWEAGRRLGFQARVCPVVRMASAGARWRKGAEVDAFLARCWKMHDGEPVDREAVYTDWLGEAMRRAGGADLVDGRVTGFRRERLVRLTQGASRHARRCERPDATMAGVLSVTDPDAFGRLLRRGIGRHRAFGYGMLLVRRVRGAR